MAVALRSFAGYLGLALVFGWGGTRQGSLVSVFQGFFAIIGEMFIFAGVGGEGGAVHGAFILWGLDTFLLSPNFLRSYVLSHSASRIYYVYK